MNFDTVIAGGVVVDGFGSPGRRLDIGIVGTTIAAVGCLASAKRARTVDASGLTVTPGFIDAHTHDDRLVVESPEVAPKISQGVTTVVTGNCGISLAPLSPRGEPPPPFDLLGGREAYRFTTFERFLRHLEQHPPAVNVACLVGHGTLRLGALEDLSRPATADERRAMAAVLRDTLAAGAIGLSSGLYYAPSAAADFAELMELAGELSSFGGVYTTHLRDEGIGVIDALQEALRLAHEADVPIVISHHKCAHPSVWGQSARTLAIIDEYAQERAVALDVYPYVASSTVLSCDAIESADRVTIAWSASMPDLAGRDLDEVASQRGVTRRALASQLMPGGGIYFKMREDDVRRILAHPLSMVGSDGLPHDHFPHPRLWGAFPRVLGHYARDTGVLSFEQAVRKMTSLPARTFGLEARGTIQVGGFADLVILDRASVRDTATFQRPVSPAAGIHRVFVNGEETWSAGRATGARAGHTLTRRDSQHTVS